MFAGGLRRHRSAGSNSSGRLSLASSTPSSSVRSWQHSVNETTSNPEFPSLVKESKRMSLNASTKHLTLNKLQFEKEKLYGRDCEVTMLKEDCLHLEGKGLILISGKPGVGKTCLAQSLTKTEFQEKVVALSGIYLASAQTEPYTGIRHVVEELCGEVLSWSAHLDPKIRERFVRLRCDLTEQLLKEEQQTLFLVFPDLDEILTLEEDKPLVQQCSQRTYPVTQERKNQFHRVFHKLLRIVSDNLHMQGKKLIILLEDLHWADQDSLAMIQTILLAETDKDQTMERDDATLVNGQRNQNRTSGDNFIIVATSRPEGLHGNTSEEGDSQNLLAKMIVCLEEKRRQSTELFVSYIRIGDLSVQEVVEMLQDVLKTDDSSIPGLARICHRKDTRECILP